MFAQDNLKFKVLSANDTVISGEDYVQVYITFSTSDGAIHHPEINVYRRNSLTAVYKSGSLAYINIYGQYHPFYIPKKLFNRKKYKVKLKGVIYPKEGNRIYPSFHFDTKLLHHSIKKVL
jgi:hypothetical protein